MINAAAGFLAITTTREIGKRYKEEWLADVLPLPGKLTKILLTTSMLLRAVPRLWWVLVAQGIPAKLARSFKLKATPWRRADGSPKPGVELARVDRRHVAIRSRSLPSGIIVVSNEEFRDFLAAAKNGDFDLAS
jgi:hypothetical protein